MFLLTASALTTLMAFGGMFRPVTKQGIDVSQVMVILVNLMPAMLAYAIPIAALFAAVLVYWRMSTDNELTACRAGGISFISVVAPAFLLGMAVASVDLLFVNYVVPQFLQKTERAVLRDLGSLIVSQVGRGERFQYGPLMVTADSAEIEAPKPSDPPGSSIVVLHGFAATALDKGGKPVGTVVGQEARLTIHNLVGQDSAEIEISLKNTSGFNPANAFQKLSGSATTLSPDGHPFLVPSYFKSKPKFLNWKDLMTLSKNPYLFPSVAEVMDRIQTARQYEQISANVYEWWQTENVKGQGRVSFSQVAMGGGGASKNEIVVQATQATLSTKGPPEESLSFLGPRLPATATTPEAPGTATPPRTGLVRVEQWINGKETTAYTCDRVDMVLTVDQYTGTGVNAALRLSGNVMRENHQQANLQPVATETQQISGIVLRPELKQVVEFDEEHMGELKTLAHKSTRKDILDMAAAADARVTKLYQTIDSELHSRGSFSLSCLTLVLLGAALGILMRGSNPLAVFVVGSVPAIILMLLITAGRQLTEGNPHNKMAGIILIWAGNGLLLFIVAGVYAKLLRR